MNSLDTSILVVSILNLALNLILTWLSLVVRRESRGTGLETATGSVSGLAGLRPSSAYSSNSQRPIIVNPRAPMDLKLDRAVAEMEARGEEANLDSLLEDEGTV